MFIIYSLFLIWLTHCFFVLEFITLPFLGDELRNLNGAISDTNIRKYRMEIGLDGISQ